jgi:hypothetical protein
MLVRFMLQNTIKQIRTWDVCIYCSPSYVYLGEMRIGEFLYFSPQIPGFEKGQETRLSCLLSFLEQAVKEHKGSVAFSKEN